MQIETKMNWKGRLIIGWQIPTPAYITGVAYITGSMLIYVSYSPSDFHALSPQQSILMSYLSVISLNLCVFAYLNVCVYACLCFLHLHPLTINLLVPHRASIPAFCTHRVEPCASFWNPFDPPCAVWIAALSLPKSIWDAGDSFIYNGNVFATEQVKVRS